MFDRAVSARTAARFASPAATALQVASVLYEIAALVLTPLSVDDLWGIALTVLSVALLELQKRLLPALFARQPAREEVGAWPRFRALYPWVIGVGASQLAFYALVYVLSPADPDVQDALGPAFGLVLLAWGAALYASYGTYAAFARATSAPGDPRVLGALREWLFGNVLATFVFDAINVSESLRAHASPLLVGLSALLGVFDVLFPLLVWRALGGGRRA